MAARHRAREKALLILYQWDMRRSMSEELAAGAQPGSDFEHDEPEEFGFTVQQALENYYGSLAIEDDEEKLPEQDVFTEELVTGVALKSSEVDALITQSATNWKIDRMPAVDRNILRIAVYEMQFTGAPPAVAIDEALLLARRYSNDESAGFINGVLDSVGKQIMKR